MICTAFFIESKLVYNSHLLLLTHSGYTLGDVRIVIGEIQKTCHLLWHLKNVVPAQPQLHDLPALETLQQVRGLGGLPHQLQVLPEHGQGFVVVLWQWFDDVLVPFLRGRHHCNVVPLVLHVLQQLGTDVVRFYHSRDPQGHDYLRGQILAIGCAPDELRQLSHGEVGRLGGRVSLVEVFDECL